MAAINKDSKIYEYAVARYFHYPVLFAEEMLGVDPDDWQRGAMEDIAKHRLVSIRSGQGVGKSALVVWVALWYICTRPYSKVVITAPTMRQLQDVLWSEIAKWLNDSKIKGLLKWTKTKVYMKGEEDRWWITARTATQPENMQGFHEDYMLFIADEASGIQDPILEAILGTLSGYENKFLMTGNPNKTSGIFYDSHNSDRHRYKTRKVSSLDSKRTNKENIDMLIEKYGRDSDVVRVRVDGDFPKAEADSLISLEIAEHAAQETIILDLEEYSFLEVGVDVARYGDDKTNIYSKLGSKIIKAAEYSKKDTMQTVGNIIRTIEDIKEEYPQVSKVAVKIDDDGLGGGVTDRLREVNDERSLGYEIIPIKNGAKPENTDMYYNKAAEMWDKAKTLLEENFSNYLQGKDPVIEIPNDQELIQQLSSRKYTVNSKGLIRLEPKEEYKKRMGISPDKADAFIYTLEEVGYTDIYALKGGRAF